MNALVRTLFISLASLFAAGAGGADSHPIFDLHFAVITKNASARSAASLDQLKTEVDILNTYFVTEGRQPIVKFRFKSAAFYDEIKNSKCELLAQADTPQPFNLARWAETFNACNDPRVRDPHAINFYVYDSYGLTTGFADTTSRGMRNSNRPFVLIDWARLNHKEQSVEEHEMGHAFGLGHECVPGAKRNTSTNIMASADCGKGSGGRRDIGFNPSQVRILLDNAYRIRMQLQKR